MFKNFGPEGRLKGLCLLLGLVELLLLGFGVFAVVRHGFYWGGQFRVGQAEPLAYAELKKLFLCGHLLVIGALLLAYFWGGPKTRRCCLVMALAVLVVLLAVSFQEGIALKQAYEEYFQAQQAIGNLVVVDLPRLQSLLKNENGMYVYLDNTADPLCQELKPQVAELAPRVRGFIYYYDCGADLAAQPEAVQPVLAELKVNAWPALVNWHNLPEAGLRGVYSGYYGQGVLDYFLCHSR